MSPRPLACVLALTSTALAVPLAGLPAGSAAAGAGPGVAAATAHPAAPGRNLQDRPQAPRTAWVWPLDPRPAVSRAFDPPPRRWLAGHRGIDMPAAEGTPVLAPRQGTVTFAGTVVDRGVVTITHPDGLRSSLEPVQPTVTVGDKVSTGQPVGVLGTGGHCLACLHWGVRRGQTYLDPLILVGPRRFAVLKPVASP